MVNPADINDKIDQFLGEFRSSVGIIHGFKSVNINVKGIIRTLDSVKYTGSGNLLDDKDVKRYLEGGGYIVGVEFIGNWGKCKFTFRIGYSKNYSYVRVSRGRNSIELTREALSKLQEVYLDIYYG